MRCENVQLQLDHAFDEGESLAGELLEHLGHCRDCAAYQQELAGLETMLRTAPALPRDPALVARIQAFITQQPARRPLTWEYGFAVALALVLLSAAGAYIDTTPLAPVRSWTQWATAFNDLSSGQALESMVLGLPATAMGQAQFTMQWVSESWGAATAQIGRLFNVGGAWLWTAFALSLVAAVALNAAEASTKHGRHTGP